MTRDELAQLDSANFELARNIIESGKNHVPIVMCVPDGPICDVSYYMESPRGKDLLGAIMHKLAQRFDLLVFIAEAWMVMIEKDEKSAKADLITAGVTPSDHPDRVEVLTVTYTVKDLGLAVAHHRIVMIEGKRTLERGALFYPERAEGRFVV